MLKVEDIMTKKVMTITPDTKLDDLAWGLTQKGVSGAPVLDAGGHLLGLVTKSDLADPTRPGRLESATAEDVMSPFVFAIDRTESVLDAAKRMVETGSHRLVVVDSSGHLAGIISSMDVVRAFVNGKLTDPEQDR
ncbi:MAG: CBS domain-containing protein [Myxococcales bacterium]|nr:CBS domain-containing protein [Myxococcales bacterium]